MMAIVFLFFISVWIHHLWPSCPLSRLTYPLMNTPLTKSDSNGRWSSISLPMMIPFNSTFCRARQRWTLNMQPEFYDYFVKRRKCQRPNKGFLHSQSSSTLLCSASTSICEHSTPMMQCRGFQSNSKYRYPHTQTGVANCSPCDILSL